MSHLLDSVDAASLRSDVPAFRPGDTVNVHVRVIEGNRSRVQQFKGVVIRRQGAGVRETSRSARSPSPWAWSAPSRCTPHRGEDRAGHPR
ncbi:hypothetical protein Sgou_32580 [Streptomyces gougerotii]|uniref:50S ribosomal protein L19 n=1 Tax=Streptomyces gougerotii TaxID=53448 RepID=A0ABQ1D7Y7_9ACTN|nr:hypothetical protein Sgou_32580 [Streptomyces gougerotii]